MYVLPNLNISTLLVESRARSFVVKLNSNVANCIIYRWLCDQSKDFDVFDNERGKWMGDKKLIKTASPDLLTEKKAGFSEECYNETSYYFENGLRKVYPYYYTFTAFAKARWVGRNIFDIFSEEFRDLSPEEYEQSIDQGKVMVNFKKITKDYKLKCNDLLVKIVHRHEYPVLYQPIPVVHIDEDILAVNKPCSIPVHPCGRYRHNSVHFILAKEYNIKNLYTIYRLDRLTSGLLLFGRTENKCKQITKDIRNRLVTKTYICRVEGEFPDSVECNVPIKQIKNKIGFSVVDPKGKECLTYFKKLSYNGKSSVVLCIPRTGRTHQLRVHLQYLGFPIVNDFLYNDTVFGPLKGKGGNFGGKSLEQLFRDLFRIHIEDTWYSNPIDLNNNDYNNVDKEQDSKSSDSTFDATKMTIDKDCLECKFLFKDPKPQNLVMYLHAWKYEGPGWKYETDLPNWAVSDWIDT